MVTNDEPHTFTEVMKHSLRRDAMAKEIHALESHKTWDIVSLPKGKSMVGCKWIYKNKYKPYGSIELQKAHLVVVKGYTQQDEINNHDNFVPDAKLVTVRTLLFTAAVRGWCCTN